MRRVLITGARAPVALDLWRTFCGAGWEAHLADSIRPWSARLSLPPGQLHGFSSPRFAFGAFRTEMTALVERLGPDLIIPTCEEVFYLAEAAVRDGYFDRVFAPPPDLLRRLHSKAQFPPLARQCGAAAPHTWRLASPQDVDAVRADAADLVFKPEFSRFASHTLIRPRPGDLAKLSPSPDQPWVAQAFVEGEEVCIWSAARDGEIVAFAAYRPAWRLGRSAAFYFSADHDPALLEMARRIAAGIGATGQLSYDVIRRPDGTIVPIECNPRCISGVHLFDSAPELAIALAGGHQLLSPDAEARHLGPAMWMLAAPSAVLQGRWVQWRTDLARSRDILAPKGRRVTVGALLDAARFAAVGFSRGQSASGQSTDDIEWNGEAIG